MLRDVLDVLMKEQENIRRLAARADLADSQLHKWACAAESRIGGVEGRVAHLEAFTRAWEHPHSPQNILNPIGVRVGTNDVPAENPTRLWERPSARISLKREGQDSDRDD